MYVRNEIIYQVDATLNYINNSTNFVVEKFICKYASQKDYVSKYWLELESLVLSLLTLDAFSKLTICKQPKK